MSLPELFLILKGGSGSGNWGHSGRPTERGGSRAGTGGLAKLDIGYDNPSVEARRSIAKIITERRKRNIPSRFFKGRYLPSSKTQTIISDVKAVIGNQEHKIEKIQKKLSKAEDNYKESLVELDHMKMRVDVSVSQRKALLDKLDKQKDTIANLNSQIITEGLKINERLNNVLKTKTPGNTTSKPGSMTNSNIQEGFSTFDKLVSKHVSKEMVVPVNNQKWVGIVPKDDEKGREYAFQGAIYVNSNTSTKAVVHELGHVLEYNNPKVYEKAKAFLEMRTQGQQPKSLREITQNSSYASDEVAIADKFPSPYVGKKYDYATEVTSMGLEYMSSNPLKFHKEDSEYFAFIVDIMNGR